MRLTTIKRQLTLSPCVIEVTPIDRCNDSGERGLTLRAPEPRESVSYEAVLPLGLPCINARPGDADVRWQALSTTPKTRMEALLQAILDDNRATVQDLLTADSSLVAARVGEARFYDQKIFHWIYVGDTALHLAAAGYRV